MELVCYAITGVAAYLLGSIPTGYLVGRARGVDIRKVGSGNIGATNTLRVLGKPAGFFVLGIDALKGWVAVRVVSFQLVMLFLPAETREQSVLIAAIVASLCAVLGHNYTVWLGFKGGKGIATSAGVLTALVPLSLVTIFGIWILLFAATRYVSIGSMGASASLPLATWVFYRNVTLTVVTGAMGALAIYKHRGNIRRLMNGTEPRFTRKKEMAK